MKGSSLMINVKVMENSCGLMVVSILEHGKQVNSMVKETILVKIK